MHIHRSNSLPLTARFSNLLALVVALHLAISACAQVHLGPKAVAAADVTEIDMERMSGLSGQDPGYTLWLKQNGKAALCALYGIPLRGYFKASLGRSEFNRLAQVLIDRGFFTRPFAAAPSIPDAPGSFIGAVADGHPMVVAEALGKAGAEPGDLYELGRAVDGIVLTTRWSRANDVPPRCEVFFKFPPRR
jgi:hypothetical protein